MKSLLIQAAFVISSTHAVSRGKSWTEVMDRINKDYEKCASIPAPPTSCIADWDFGCRQGKNDVGGLLYRDCCGGRYSKCNDECICEALDIPQDDLIDAFSGMSFFAQ